MNYKRESNDFPEYGKIKYTSDVYLFLNSQKAETGEYVEYMLPIKEGDNVVILQLADLHTVLPNRNVFSIYVGETLVKYDVDVVDIGTPRGALSYYVPLKLEDGKVYLEGNSEPVESPFPISNNRLRLVFKPIKGRLDLFGLISFHGSLEETNYNFQDRWRLAWRKHHHNMDYGDWRLMAWTHPEDAARRNKHKQRNDQVLDLSDLEGEEIIEEFHKDEPAKVNKFRAIIYAILAILTIFFFLFQNYIFEKIAPQKLLKKLAEEKQSSVGDKGDKLQ